MPLYEYMCHRCGKTIESLQRFSDEPLTVHEGCGGELEKLISRSAFQLKGSGWYATDYAHGSSKTGIEASNGSADSKAENKTEGKSESKSESKGESKAEAKTESKSESKSESKPAPASSDKSS
jgi:putative FmdB family regulatory protein